MTICDESIIYLKHLTNIAIIEENEHLSGTDPTYRRTPPHSASLPIPRLLLIRTQVLRVHHIVCFLFI